VGRTGARCPLSASGTIRQVALSIAGWIGADFAFWDGAKKICRTCSALTWPAVRRGGPFLARKGCRPRRPLTRPPPRHLHGSLTRAADAGRRQPLPRGRTGRRALVPASRAGGWSDLRRCRGEIPFLYADTGRTSHPGVGMGRAEPAAPGRPGYPSGGELGRRGDLHRRPSPPGCVFSCRVRPRMTH
jgi:hypothetical protein